MIKAKKSGAGHKMYKVCRRVLTGPIVKTDTYCLEVVGKELRGEGEVNAQGEREGRGTMVYDDGSMYEGQWRAGKKHGRGKYSFATGDVYEGEYTCRTMSLIIRGCLIAKAHCSTMRALGLIIEQ
jgi:hypothetical protein